MKTQSTTATDCRCKACGALLAKRDRDGLTIRRGDMQVVVSGDSTVGDRLARADRARMARLLEIAAAIVAAHEQEVARAQADRLDVDASADAC